MQHDMCFWLETNFVRKSTHIEVDGVNFNSIFLSSIKSRKKWCLKETCRILSLIFGFHATFIHDWLSHFNSNVGTLNKFNSSSIAFIQIPSFVASATATYSTSIDDNATVVCFLDRQAIAPPASVSTCPLVDFRLFAYALGWVWLHKRVSNC